MTYVPKGKGSTKITQLPHKPKTMDEVFEAAYPPDPTPVDIEAETDVTVVPSAESLNEAYAEAGPKDQQLRSMPPWPTLDEALAHVRAREAKVVGLSMDGELTIRYANVEDIHYKGMTIAQLVPFSEVLLHGLGLTVPTIECPYCTRLGRNVRNCSSCGGKGSVLASQVTSKQAAMSPTLDRYRDSDTKPK